jgi:glycosyltransferase involved in cell wall biosynthesis
MKVVIAHNRYRSDAPSGENVIVDLEIGQLTAAGVTVLPFQRESDDIPRLPLPQKALLPVSPIYSPWSASALADLLRRERPDVLHLHNPYPLLSPWVVRTAHAAGVPVIQTVHNYRQVCAPGVFFRDGHNCVECQGKRFALPAIQHRCYRGSAAQSAIMATTLAVHRGTWRSVERYIALTDAIADHLRSYGITDRQIVVKPNSVEDPGDPLPLGEGMLFAARLSPEKGLGLLLEAWTRHPVGKLGTLRIAGDGELRQLAVDTAAARSDVEYLGPLDRMGVRAAIQASAVVAIPSMWQDVLPTMALEALANGRPVMGTDLGGLPFILGAGQTTTLAGWMFPPAADHWSAGLEVALGQAEHVSPIARERYLSTFHPGVVTRRLINIYEDVARQGVAR